MSAAAEVEQADKVDVEDTLAEDYTVVSVYVRPDGRRVVHVWGPPGTQREARNRAARMRTRDRREYAEDPRLEALSLHVCKIADEDQP